MCKVAEFAGEDDVNDQNVIGAFGEEEAARLSGLSVGQLRLWDRSGFLKPSYASASRHLPHNRIYSFRDIVSLRVLGQLRNKLKVPMQQLRKVSEKLAEFGDQKWTATTLYVLGKRVVFTDPRSKKRMEVVSRQQVLDIPLRVVISDTKRAIAEMNTRDPAELGHVVQGKFVQQNEPVFEGTRIPVMAVRRYLEAGFGVDEIVREFPLLTRDDIEAARNFDPGVHAA
jgi:uncharacterized protein (DUF433 family)